MPVIDAASEAVRAQDNALSADAGKAWIEGRLIVS